MTRLVLACLGLALAVQPVGARPAGIAVVATVAYQYIPGDSDPYVSLESDVGGQLFLVNLDPLGAHNLVSTDTIDGEPLFQSDFVNPGEATEVVGVDQLTAGEYGFMCTVHGYEAMNGQLNVV